MVIKISLADAANSRGCSIDYLLALAESGELAIFARLGPYCATYKDRRGRPPSALDPQGRPQIIFGPQSTGGASYTALLPFEAGYLRTGPLTIRTVREEGAENGVHLPVSSDEEYLLHLTEPQTVTIDTLCVNADQDATSLVSNAAAKPTATLPRPLQRSAAQDDAILAAIHALGLNPLALPRAPKGGRGPRAAVREFLEQRDSKEYRQIFSSKKVFETAWQRLLDADQLCDGEPTPLQPPRK